jgi:hypothetical protein
LLISGTDTAWSCYHCNAEHSQGEANLEISGTTGAIKNHGFKADGNYIQVWVRDAASFWLQEYGDNAAPFSFNCTYPPGYAPYPPSLLRVERTPPLVIANVITQLKKNRVGNSTMRHLQYWVCWHALQSGIKVQSAGGHSGRRKVSRRRRCCGQYSTLGASGDARKASTRSD